MRVVEAVIFMREEDVAGHLARQRRVGFLHLRLDEAVAGLPHHRVAAQFAHAVEQRLAGLHIGDDRRTGQLAQHRLGQDRQELIAPDDAALAVDRADPVAVAVERQPEIELLFGFCVSVEHAHFMAQHFSRHGIPAVAVSGNTPRVEREGALRDLAAGRVRVVFSVDLFNEGVDVPAVDTVIMLRPTESPTLFLQQLGRGLRKTRDKSTCTVLDFVGTHRKEFRFDRRFRALLGGTRRDVERAVQLQFPFLPAGCHMQLDAVASEIVLRSLRDAIPTRWPAKVDELRSLRTERPNIGLGEFLHESGLDLEDVYDGGRVGLIFNRRQVLLSWRLVLTSR